MIALLPWWRVDREKAETDDRQARTMMKDASSYKALSRPFPLVARDEDWVVVA